MSSSPSRRTVVIGVPTFRRPDRLGALLDALPDQISAAEGVHDVSIGVTVVDNDPAASAKSITDARRIDYVLEPTPGVASVRNAALDAAASADALVFIDDDELPEPGWLVALLEPWLAGRAELVSGTVTSRFATTLDPWIEAGGFFRRVEFADGAAMPYAATNNLLLDVAFLRTQQIRFDPQFGLSGGEDIDLTKRAVACGARLVACPAARVLDPVPAERMTRGWVLRRAFRVGTTAVRTDLSGGGSWTRRLRVRVRWLADGVVRIVAGAARSLVGVLGRSISHRARGARLAARGAGMVAGAVGIRYREYSDRHAGSAQPQPSAWES